MKFIHAADIHLDSPLTGLAFYPGVPVDLLRAATRDAFTNLVDIAIEEAVDFMIIAGDLYDGAWKDYNTGLHFCHEMGRLNKVGIPVYLLFGNHDAESEMTKKLMLPSNVHEFDSRKATTFLIEAHQVALHGRSFKDKETTDNLVPSYPDAVAGWLNIGVLHTALEGNSKHANYAPCSIAELSAKGYDYWALGHVHEYTVIQQAPCWIVFPGNLQGRHIRETGPKGAVIVNADETGVLSVERLMTDVLRWHVVDVDASGAVNINEVVRLIGQSFEHLVEVNHDNKPMMARVILAGKTAAHGELFGMAAHLHAEVLGQAAAIGVGQLWIEKVVDKTQSLLTPVEIKARSDAIADLQVLLEDAPHDTLLLKDLEKELQQMVGKMPPELLAEVAAFKDIRNGELTALITSASSELVDYLSKTDQG